MGNKAEAKYNGAQWGVDCAGRWDRERNYTAEDAGSLADAFHTLTTSVTVSLL